MVFIAAVAQILLLLSVGCAADLAAVNSAQYFPETIPYYPVRRDIYTNETVSRGRVHLINYPQHGRMIPPNTPEQKAKMVKMADLQRHLQCASPEPELDGNRGVWSMIKMAPPTKESIEQMCAWAESKCEPWVRCRDVVKSYKAGGFDKGMDYLGRVWIGRSAIMVRVIDNELYYDWPWGMERFKSQESHYSNLLTDHMAMIEIVLRTVSDIGNSVFFFGGEQPFLKWNVPLPLFSFAPDLQYGDMPFPWLESLNMEFAQHMKADGYRNDSAAFHKREQTPWEKRIPKAAFFASFQNYRQLIFDSAALRPDLFDVSYASNNRMEAWNPLSDEPEVNPYEPNGKPAGKESYTAQRNHSGFIQPILQFGDARHYQPHNYKYVIVPLGSGAQSTSGRLAGLLAHSGAVVLLQASSFSYHFTARLIPWVHYVPLSFSMADVIDKVQWLTTHDAQARQIVQNAENFARSYLRLEDYFCYVAGALNLISKMENTTDALEGFSPRLIHRVGR